MNIFGICVVFYFIIGLICELIVFKQYFENKKQLTDSEVVEFQIAIWGWPVLAVLGIVFGILYFGMVVMLKMFETVFLEEFDY